MNQVVARFLDGRILKGQTNDFLPARSVFHLVPEGAKAGDKPLEMQIAELKALFFVRNLAGDPQHKKTNAFDPFKAAPGRKVRVEFKDGEVLIGTTQGYQPDRPGFFVIPADSHSNNERCFVVTAAAKQVQLM
ncbi:MAG TPA: hypothetical protein VFM84_01605 [Holophagaceae bacterium]|nr:hypothetical protein [Holophagaceae bacterium]